MQLVQVHVVGPQAVQRASQRESDVSGIEIRPDLPMVEIAADLGREEHLVPASFEGLPEDFLAVPPSVDVRGIEEVHPKVDGLLDGGDRFCVVRGAVRIPVGVSTDRPGPESDFRDLEAGFPERPSSHRRANEALSKNLSDVGGRRQTPPSWDTARNRE